MCGHNPALWQSGEANGAIERLFGTLNYEHLTAHPSTTAAAWAIETARFRDIYETIRPRQALGMECRGRPALNAEVLRSMRPPS
jgi:transposase InsO family protein